MEAASRQYENEAPDGVVHPVKLTIITPEINPETNIEFRTGFIIEADFLDDEPIKYIYGEDSLQSLELCLKIAKVSIELLAKKLPGKRTLFGSNRLF